MLLFTPNTFVFLTFLESLTLREERRLRIFENRILRQIFGTNGDENG